MPELTRFYGIIIRMYYDDHVPSHFHAFYGEHEAAFEIETLAEIKGGLPARARGLVIEWGQKHKNELRKAWKKASNLEKPDKIAPLD
jgi:hypothetical protein